MYCQTCGRQHPTVPVKLDYNIGMIYLRRYGNIGSRLCRTCAIGHLWEFNAINHGVGWWSVISFVMTIFAVFGNWAQLPKILRLPKIVTMEPPRCMKCGGFQTKSAPRRPAVIASIAVAVFFFGLWGARLLRGGYDQGNVIFILVFYSIVSIPALVCAFNWFRSRKVACINCKYQWFV